jgi:hypothetical protein
MIMQNGVATTQRKLNAAQPLNNLISGTQTVRAEVTHTRWSIEEMREVVRHFLASGNYKEAYELWRNRNLNTRPKQGKIMSEGAEQNMVRAKLKVQLQVAWHKVKFLQMSDRRKLPQLAENNKLVCLKKQVNDIIKELLEENVTDITGLNDLIQAAVTVITETVTQPSKTMKNWRFKDF